MVSSFKMSLQVCETDKLHLHYIADECLLLIYFILCLIIFVFTANSNKAIAFYNSRRMNGVRCRYGCVVMFCRP